MAAWAGEPVQALLFDLDGTLIDSMPLHHDAWQQWFALQRLPFDEAGFFAASAGRTNAEILADLLPTLSTAARQALAEQKEALYRADARSRLAPVAGALPLLAAAAERGRAVADFETFNLDAVCPREAAAQPAP